jgi:hypothetical protein
MAHRSKPPSARHQYCYPARAKLHAAVVQTATSISIRDSEDAICCGYFPFISVFSNEQMEAEPLDFMRLMIDELRRDELLPFSDQSIEWKGDNSQYGWYGTERESTSTNEVLPSGWAVGVRSAYYVY